MSHPVRWFEIYVEDMPRARKFYESVFQLELTKIPTPASMANDREMWGFPSGKEDEYGATGALVWIKGLKPGGSGTIVYFGSEDCAVEEKRIREAGGEIQKPKLSIGQFGHMVLGIDTEGNMIGVHSMS